MPSYKTKPSRIRGLRYDVVTYAGNDLGFSVIHEKSGLRAVHIYGAKRPATEFVKWADYSLAGPDWTMNTNEASASLEIRTAVDRFKRGLENIGPKYRDVIQVKPEALALLR